MTSLFDSPEFNERLFFPRQDRSPPPDGARELDVAGDETLHVRCYQATAGRPTVLLFHGNGEVVSDYDDQAPLFAKCGANLAVMDYRGYGRSTGTPTLRSALADAHRVLAAVREVATPLIVMGRSLGSACAAELYATSPDGVIGFVLESGFVDLGALVRRRGMKPPTELAPSDRNAFDAERKLAKGRLPLLVLHGGDDTMIVPAEARRAHAAAGASDKELVVIPGHGHNDVSSSPLYWDALQRFVTRITHLSAA